MTFSFVSIKEFFSSFNALALNSQDILTVAFFISLIFLYSVFIWKVYHMISKKDIISLNLRQYNSLEHPVMNKILAGILYFIEYIIILPFLILFWYVLFAVVLLIFSEGLAIKQVLFLSAAVVGSIRLLAYYKHEISAEIAKLLPFTILAITLLNPKFLDLGRFYESIVQVPNLIFSIGYILLFIICLEIVLRLADLFKRIIVNDK